MAAKERASGPAESGFLHACRVSQEDWAGEAKRARRIEGATASQAAASGYWAEGALGGKARVGQESRRREEEDCSWLG